MGVCKEVLWNHRENLFVENMESQGDFVDSAESSDSIFWICKYGRVATQRVPRIAKRFSQ